MKKSTVEVDLIISKQNYSENRKLTSCTVKKIVMCIFNYFMENSHFTKFKIDF